MQSLTAKITCALLCAVFHSPFSDSSKHSDIAGKKARKAVSRYKPSEDFSHFRYSLGNAFYERLVHKSKSTDTVVFLIHGGSFKVGLVDMYRRLAEKLSLMLNGAEVISVDYRLFPEYTFPCQLEDTVNVYKHLLENGTKPESIVFVGDSAGATLCLTSALYLRDNGLPLPGKIVCFSLWGDATSSGASRIKNAYRDPFGGIARRKKLEDNLDYLHRISKYAEKLDRTDPYVSPCFGDFEGFPPVTLICGEAEMDESDNDTVFRKMKSVGVDVQLHKFEGMFHCFEHFSFLPESRRAYEIAIKRIKEK